MSVSSRKPVARRRGTSLIEVAVSTLIVGLLLVAATRTVGAVFRTQAATANLYDGTALCKELLTEIMQSYYEDPEDPGGPIALEIGEVVGTRQDWDDVDDYDNLVETPPVDRQGNPIAGYNGWTRAVSVDYVNANDPENPVGTDEGLKRIIVTATAPDGTQTTLQALRSHQGVLEQDPDARSTLVTWVGGELQIGGTAAGRGDTNLVNHTPDQ